MAARHGRTRRETADGTDGPRRSRGRLLVGATVGCVAVLVGSFLVASHLRAGAVGPTGQLRAHTTHASPSLVAYRDPQQRFTIGVPPTWRQIRPSGHGVALLVDAGGLNSMLVRVVPLGRAVGGRADLRRLKRVTDDLIDANGVTVIAERSIRLNGARGYYYLYSTASSKQAPAGLHAHYFLFRDRRMFVLVFQALPASGFSALAPTFDAVAESFRPGG